MKMNPANFADHSTHTGAPPGFWDLAGSSGPSNPGISGGPSVEYGPLWEHHSAGYHSELLAAGYPVTPELWASSSSVRPPYISFMSELLHGTPNGSTSGSPIYQMSQREYIPYTALVPT
uniref:Uncharacterized protein n=1 Tax=Cacopsylla melanoneura TaxID=428564 RepID=A0A8D9F5A3_9HEMI